MNLHRLLQKRAEDGEPVRVGLIGAGKFGSMFLATCRTTPGLRLVALADLSTERAGDALAATGWGADAGTTDAGEAERTERVWLTEDSAALIAMGGLEVVIEATGDPAAGIAHCLAAIAEGRHAVMVNVEADALAGPFLAARAAKAGVVYTLAYGDQPALICEQVDWARASGFEVVSAGKGTLYMPAYHASTPDTVWDHFGFTPEHAAASGMNPKMFNSFLDGTKSAIEMAAVANATGLTPQPGGLRFPACGTQDLARITVPEADGGALAQAGTVEVVSSRERDGRDVFNDLRWGTYVTFAAPSDYVERCFADYGLKTDPSGRYAALWRPYHLIGLELGISVASAALRKEPTGAPDGFRGDVVATAKRALKSGEVLDGEGGYCVYGTLLPAADSLAGELLPLGLAHDVTLKREIAPGEHIRWSDVTYDEAAAAVKVRRAMEQEFRGANA